MAIGNVIQEIQPECLYLPYPGDAHSDHRIGFEASSTASKWFRYPSIRRVVAYETLSETEFGISPVLATFRPNYFVDITDHLDKKLELLRVYRDQMGTFPFPRSTENIVALSRLRGATAGCHAAEAFMLLKEIW